MTQKKLDVMKENMPLRMMFWKACFIASLWDLYVFEGIS